MMDSSVTYDGSSDVVCVYVRLPGVKHHDVLHDPVFHDLLRRHERAAQLLRDSVIALRVWHLYHEKHPGEEDIGEKWRTAILQEAAARALDQVEDAAAELLRYGFEIAPHSGGPEHLEEIAAARAAHKKRVDERTGWGSRPIENRGPEEQVKIDNGPPITIVLHKDPKHPKPPKRGTGH